MAGEGAMMGAREDVLGRIRAALHAGAADAGRGGAVAVRLRRPPAGVIPQRGQLPAKERAALFCAMAEKHGASVARLRRSEDVPREVARYLRDRNLPAAIRMGGDPRLAGMPWAGQRALEVRRGASDGDDLAGVSHAFAGIAETGTLALLSGPQNPTTINLLPEHHIVVVDAATVEGGLEAVLARVRETFGKGRMPRTVNFITGPSRSSDIEQKVVLGAHGPRALHVVVVG
jgi:L-lactate dehydrogenase complex protein LldG